MVKKGEQEDDFEVSQICFLLSSEAAFVDVKIFEPQVFLKRDQVGNDVPLVDLHHDSRREENARKRAERVLEGAFAQLAFKVEELLNYKF
jgi:hypothetical protein